MIEPEGTAELEVSTEPELSTDIWTLPTSNRTTIARTRYLWNRSWTTIIGSDRRRDGRPRRDAGSSRESPKTSAKPPVWPPSTKEQSVA